MEFERFKNNLIKKKKTFKIVYFNSHAKIVATKKGGGLKDRFLGGFNFPLSNEVKKDAEVFFGKNREALQEYKEKKIQYILEPKIKPLFKCDIEKAYWSAASQFFLSKKTYEKGLKVGKTARLQALGSLATKKKEVYYINGQKVKEISEINELFPVYNLVASTIDDFMKMFAFEGYWVDCGFFSCKETLENFCYACEKAGLSFKIETVRSYKNFKNYHWINGKIYTFKKIPTLEDLNDF